MVSFTWKFVKALQYISVGGNMKKITSILIALILCITFASCGGTECTHSSAECDGKCDLCGADFGATACVV